MGVEQGPVEQAHRPAGDDVGVAPGLEHGSPAGVPGRAGGLAEEFAIRQQAHPGLDGQGGEAPPVERSAHGHPHPRADAGREGGLDGRRVDDRGQSSPGVAGGQQGLNDGQAVSARARAGRVGGVDKHNGRRLDPGGGRQGLDRDPGRVGQTGQRHAHLLVLLPEQIGDRDGLALGPGGVAIHRDQAVGAQFGYVGERIAPHQGGGDAAGRGLDGLGALDGEADRAGLGDELVAADEGGHGHHGADRPDLAAQDAQQGPGRALAGGEEVDVRVGVIDDGDVAVLEHALGEHAMQIERDDDWDALAEDGPRLLEQVALRVVLALGRHCAVQAEIGAIDGPGGAQGLQPLAGEAQPVGGGQGPAGGDGPRAQGRNEAQVGLQVEDAQRPADLVAHAAVVVDEGFAGQDIEVGVVAGDGVEGRDFLAALGDEDCGHGRGLWGRWSGGGNARQYPWLRPHSQVAKLIRKH